MKRISEDNHRAESKLWNSYREGEAREKALRKQLNKTQKVILILFLDHLTDSLDRPSLRLKLKLTG